MKKGFTLCLLLLLVGCSEREQVEVYTKTNNEPLQQQIVQLIKDDSDVAQANVFVVENTIFVALQLKPFSKWQKQKVEEAWQQKVEQQFHEKTVFVSTDFKLYWESSKLLEEDEQSLQQKLLQLKKLAKEET